MRRLLAWLAGAAGLAALVRSRKRHATPAADPAEDLRAKLAEARSAGDDPLESDRADFEAGETAVDEVDVDARRANVHEQARAAIDDMNASE